MPAEDAPAADVEVGPPELLGGFPDRFPDVDAPVVAPALDAPVDDETRKHVTVPADVDEGGVAVATVGLFAESIVGVDGAESFDAEAVAVGCTKLTARTALPAGRAALRVFVV